MADGAWFHLLGPVQVGTAAGPVRFARRQHRDLVVHLALRTGDTVTAEQLTAAMWGERVPATGRSQLKNMLSAARAALAGTGAAVERSGSGYRLTGAAVDAARFAELIARRRWREALALWHGPVALDGVGAAYAVAARVRLDEQRATATEDLFDAELAAGRHRAIVPELVTAVAARPGRERLVGQLMTALYRSGRQTEALQAYRDLRRALADGFGLEPGAALRDLEGRILRADPALLPPPETLAQAVRVLVVDDQTLIRAGLVALLRAAPGIEVVGEAADGAEAVRAALTLRPDVVLMDVRMPGSDGLTATEQIVPAGPRVIVLTTFDQDEYVHTALRHGAHGFLLKDTPPERLLAAVAAVADGEMLFAPSVTRRLVEAYRSRPEPP